MNRYKTSIKNYNVYIKKRFINILSIESKIFNIKENDVSDRIFSQTKLASELVQRGRDIIPIDKLYSNSMEEYITLRKFKNQDNFDNNYNDSANRILSAALTFPLSLSYALNNIFPYGLPSSSLNSIKILIIGARSESSLPKIWWKELLMSLNNDNNDNDNDNNKRLIIDFLGPDLQINQLNNINENIIFSSNKYKFNHMIEFKELNISNKLCLHQHKDYLSILKEYDIFVMYNPGLGSTPLKGKWDETLRLLLMTRKPIICTAHSSGDCMRDLDTIRKISDEEDIKGQDLGEPIDWIIEPHENPYRSLKPTIDNKETQDNTKIVTTNHYIYSFVSK